MSSKVRHLWNASWESTYCGNADGVRTTTMFLVTCQACYKNLQDMIRLETEDELTVEQMFEEAE